MYTHWQSKTKVNTLSIKHKQKANGTEEGLLLCVPGKRTPALLVFCGKQSNFFLAVTLYQRCKYRAESCLICDSAGVPLLF